MVLLLTADVCCHRYLFARDENHRSYRLLQYSTGYLLLFLTVKCLFSRRLGASHSRRDSDSGLANGPDRTPRPGHLTLQQARSPAQLCSSPAKNQQMTYTWALVSLTYIAVTCRVTSAMTSRISRGILEPLPCSNYKNSCSRFSQSEANEMLGRSKVTSNFIS